MGRSQVVRHRVLILHSQVRILAPQPDNHPQGISMSSVDVMLFSGNANPGLAADIARNLNMPLGKIDVGASGDGEIMVEIAEKCARAQRVYPAVPVYAGQ